MATTYSSYDKYKDLFDFGIKGDERYKLFCDLVEQVEDERAVGYTADSLAIETFDHYIMYVIGLLLRKYTDDKMPQVFQDEAKLFIHILTFGHRNNQAPIEINIKEFINGINSTNITIRQDDTSVLESTLNRVKNAIRNISDDNAVLKAALNAVFTKNDVIYQFMEFIGLFVYKMTRQLDNNLEKHIKEILASTSHDNKIKHFFTKIFNTPTSDVSGLTHTASFSDTIFKVVVNITSNNILNSILTISEVGTDTRIAQVQPSSLIKNIMNKIQRTAQESANDSVAGNADHTKIHKYDIDIDLSITGPRTRARRLQGDVLQMPTKLNEPRSDVLVNSGVIDSSAYLKVVFNCVLLVNGVDDKNEYSVNTLNSNLKLFNKNIFNVNYSKFLEKFIQAKKSTRWTLHPIDRSLGVSKNLQPGISHPEVDLLVSSNLSIDSVYEIDAEGNLIKRNVISGKQEKIDSLSEKDIDTCYKTYTKGGNWKCATYLRQCLLSSDENDIRRCKDFLTDSDFWSKAHDEIQKIPLDMIKTTLDAFQFHLVPVPRGNIGKIVLKKYQEVNDWLNTLKSKLSDDDIKLIQLNKPLITYLEGIVKKINRETTLTTLGSLSSLTEDEVKKFNQVLQNVYGQGPTNTPHTSKSAKLPQGMQLGGSSKNSFINGLLDMDTILDDHMYHSNKLNKILEQLWSEPKVFGMGTHVQSEQLGGDSNFNIESAFKFLMRETDILNKQASKRISTSLSKLLDTLLIELKNKGQELNIDDVNMLKQNIIDLQKYESYLIDRMIILAGYAYALNTGATKEQLSGVISFDKMTEIVKSTDVLTKKINNKAAKITKALQHTVKVMVPGVYLGSQRMASLPIPMP